MTKATSSVAVKRVYAAPAANDGIRVLVDGLWPRGIRKSALKIDHWMKELAPSTALRQWFNHDPEKWVEFQKRYRHELKGNATLAELRRLAERNHVTLLFAARDEQHNNAVVLERMLRRRS